MMGTESPARVGFETIPRSKVYQEVAKQLERHIAEELKPGDLLPPERELVRMLGVSRGSVRDAIRSLELMGLLEPRHGIGTVVRSPGATPANPLATALLEKRKMVAELLDVRQMLEPPLAGRAAVHASRDEIAEMEEILARQEANVRRGELGIEEDSEFHYSIALASDNSAILKVVDVLMDLLRGTRERSLQVEGRQQKSLAGHRRILAALKRGDAAAAEAAMRRHLQEMEDIVLKKL
ncbi:MAG: FadR/GntR family transcriptional regulator [Terriglobales bacterium]|jgi:GntR family transcriptional repressor for pyruvate dehydrogenase complex